jgi:hypothetical protein
VVFAENDLGKRRQRALGGDFVETARKFDVRRDMARRRDKADARYEYQPK